MTRSKALWDCYFLPTGFSPARTVEEVETTSEEPRESVAVKVISKCSIIHGVPPLVSEMNRSRFKAFSWLRICGTYLGPLYLTI